MQSRGNFAGRLSMDATDDRLVEKTMDFIWDCLVPWRDDPERPKAEVEEELNAQFQNFLSSRALTEFPMVTFQHEQRQLNNRRIDLAVKPIHGMRIEGVLYSKYDPILVIEGKRLPAPRPKKREKEYVTGGEKAAGGIQRFKLGLHGKNHKVAILLGYLQKGGPDKWLGTINQWIKELSGSESAQWSEAECLSDLSHITDVDRARAVSNHPRGENCTDLPIELHHYWIQSP